MQEYWTFELPLSEKTLPEQLMYVLKEQERELGIFITYYFKREGAVAEKVQVKGEPVFSNEIRGRLRFVFDLVHFNACLAIHEQSREEMEITFEILDPERKLKLTGPYWPEREMDEI